MTEIVSREEWELMLARSRRLQSDIAYHERRGDGAKVARLWDELRPLNRKIRNPSLMRVRGIDA